MLLGFLSAKGILTAALNQLPPDMFLAQDTAQLQELVTANGSGEWEYLILSAFVTLLFAFLAAAPAARYAASVPCYGDAWKRENENQKEKPQGKEDKELRKILCRTQSAA